jgi:O-antigen/teichoic acid export membrane protein
LLPFALWFWLADLLTNLFGAVDRLMIVHFAPSHGQDRLAMLGQYHSSQIIGTLLTAMTGMLAGVLLSYLSYEWESGERRRAEQLLDVSLKQIALLLTFLAAVGLLVAPGVFAGFLHNRYAEGFRVLPLTMTYCIWFGLLGVAQNYLWCRERAWWVSAAMFTGLLINVVLNAWWLPYWGLPGAVAATAIANLMTLLMVMASCHLLGMRYGRDTWVAIFIPSSLAFGGWPALAVVMLYVAVGLAGGWLLSVAQIAVVERQRDAWLRRWGWESAGDPTSWPNA